MTTLSFEEQLEQDRRRQAKAKAFREYEQAKNKLERLEAEDLDVDK